MSRKQDLDLNHDAVAVGDLVVDVSTGDGAMTYRGDQTRNQPMDSLVRQLSHIKNGCVDMCWLLINNQILLLYSLFMSFFVGSTNLVVYKYY